MPVRKLAKRQSSPRVQTLLDCLVTEWKATGSSATQPVILEESDRSDLPIHIYVVWDEWIGLSGAERSEVIMDACEAVYGQAGAANVTVAMGLTSIEADRIGIKYH